MKMSAKYLPGKYYVEIGGTRLYKDCRKDRYETKYVFEENQYDTALFMYNGLNIGPGFKKRLVHSQQDGIVIRINHRIG